MGYRPGKNIFNIEFAEHPGLEVRAASTSLGNLLHVAQLNVKVNEQDEKKRMEIFVFFADQLESWNVEHPDTVDNTACAQCGLMPGEDLPATIAGILCLDLGFIMEIILGWMTAIARVSFPKGSNSSNGENQLEDLMLKLAKQANLST